MLELNFVPVAIFVKSLFELQPDESEFYNSEGIVLLINLNWIGNKSGLSNDFSEVRTQRYFNKNDLIFRYYSSKREKLLK